MLIRKKGIDLTEDNAEKDLGAKAFSYGYASPVLMAATYNEMARST